MEFPERLSNMMAEKKITAYRLAKEIEVHPSTIKNWLDGKYSPKSSMIRELATVLGVTKSYLLMETDNPEVEYVYADELFPMPEVAPGTAKIYVADYDGSVSEAWWTKYEYDIAIDLIKVVKKHTLPANKKVREKMKAAGTYVDKTSTDESKE